MLFLGWVFVVGDWLVGWCWGLLYWSSKLLLLVINLLLSRVGCNVVIAYYVCYLLLVMGNNQLLM